ncbi:MAG: phosphonate C-P lyase system protein PhnG [Oscillospiraceae bacterium]|jgi:alpha-D-ribose 1-methylphosphonate 5-triphosphate synthase subunit PhnG|nr:phosphonate C-P lyase system protein PhnG [Oscillospiraceae bacterium]
MKKRDISGALSFAGREDVLALAGKIEANHDVSALTGPHTVLVMLKFRESAGGALFYAAEALACECYVKLGDTRGFAACLGDDLDKVRAMAVIDAALNAGVPETGEITAALGIMSAKTAEARALEARLAMSTKVDFSIMEE